MCPPQEGERIQATEEEKDNLDLLIDSAAEEWKDSSRNRETDVRRSPSGGNSNSLDVSRRGLLAARGKRPSMASLNESSTSFNRELRPDEMGGSQHSLQSCLSTSQQGGGMKRTNSTVSFNSVEVREYTQTMGDNPSCMSGPAISLDWEYSNRGNYCINDFETNGKRKSYGKYPRRLPKVHRENFLKYELGYSDEEIAMERKEAKKIQRSVSMTKFVTQMGFGKVQDLVARKSGEDVSRPLHKSMNDLRIESSASLSSLEKSQRSLTASTSSHGSNESTLNF